MIKMTESASIYDDLEHMSALELVTNINREDKKVATAIELILPKIAILIDVITDKMLAGGRLFYIGAGTSGRLGIVDASECPPTFGIPAGMVIGIIAGGDEAIKNAIEFSEDNTVQGWLDLQAHHICGNDIIIGIAASGTTPYVIHALKKCKEHQIITACITSNICTPLAEMVDFPIEVNLGPEFVTGSTRMKSGTAQKMILNMISTSVMIKLGRVQGNIMVDMALTNDKLIERGTQMVVQSTKLSYEEARELLMNKGSVRAAIDSLNLDKKID
jgi:N-acetylmuramic acid 6-phosphate etherase